MSIVNYNTSGFVNSEIPVEYFTQDNYSASPSIINFGTDILEYREVGVESIVYQGNHSKITVRYSDDNARTGIIVYFYYDNQSIWNRHDGNVHSFYGYALGIDEDNHLGYFTSVYKYTNQSNYTLEVAYAGGDATWYNFIKDIPQVDLNRSGGAGSGYIGNSLLSNKKMVGYNVPTSSAESTKTESVDEASENPVSGKPKIGNGFARIKFLREPSTFLFGDLAKTLDITHKQVTGWDNSGIEDGVVTQYLSSYFGTDYILVAQQNNGNYFNTFDGNEGIGYEKTINTGCAIYYPIRPIVVTKIKCSSKFDTTGSLSNDSYFELYVAYIENGSMNHITVGSHNKSKEWGIIEKEFDSPVKVEYIEFVVMDNQWHFKDVEITGVLL